MSKKRTTISVILVRYTINRYVPAGLISKRCVKNRKYFIGRSDGLHLEKKVKKLFSFFEGLFNELNELNEFI